MTVMVSSDMPLEKVAAPYSLEGVGGDWGLTSTGANKKDFSITSPREPRDTLTKRYVTNTLLPQHTQEHASLLRSMFIIS